MAMADQATLKKNLQVRIDGAILIYAFYAIYRFLDGILPHSICPSVLLKPADFVQALLKLPDNDRCADCKIKSPTWASKNLGIFVCMDCAGCHRSMGTHIRSRRAFPFNVLIGNFAF